MPEMKLWFNPDGTVHKETSGFTGKDCEDLTDFIEKEFGGYDMVRTRKASFNASTNKQKRRTFVNNYRTSN